MDVSIRDMPERHDTKMRRTILATALLVISAVILGLPLLAILYRLIVPDAIVYQNWPYQVIGTYMPGDVISYRETLCINEFPGSDVIGYAVDRSLVNALDGAHMALPRLTYGAPDAGCLTRPINIITIPQVVPPGRYYIEGITNAYTRRSQSNAYFRTTEFNIIERKDGWSLQQYALSPRSVPVSSLVPQLSWDRTRGPRESVTLACSCSRSPLALGRE